MIELLFSYSFPCGDYGSYLHRAGVRRLQTGVYLVSVPLQGLWFLSSLESSNVMKHIIVSVPLRGLWFLSAPFINGFMKPLKWHFAGRIIYFHHFSSFVRKWFSKNCLKLNFKAAGRNRPACIFKKQVRHINNVCLTNSYYNTSS